MFSEHSKIAVADLVLHVSIDRASLRTAPNTRPARASVLASLSNLVGAGLLALLGLIGLIGLITPGCGPPA